MNNRLKECRLKKGYTQQYVALTLGIKSPSVSNWENGKTFPTTENLTALSKLYDVPLDYLMGKNNEAGAADTPALSSDQQEVLRMYSKLREEDRKAFTRQLRFTLSEYQNGEK